MVDAVDFFPDDVNVSAGEEVIYLVDAAGGRVFDREHAIGRLSILDRLDDIGKRHATSKDGAVRFIGEELLRGQMAIRPFYSLKCDAP